jgi:hypothetical protein
MPFLPETWKAKVTECLWEWRLRVGGNLIVEQMQYWYYKIHISSEADSAM